MSNEQNGTKTEQPTPQRIRQAREKGQIGYSTDLVAACILVSAAGIAYLFADTALTTVLAAIRNRMQQLAVAVESPQLIVTAMKQDTIAIGAVTILFTGLLSAVALGTGLLQTQFNLSFQALTLKWNKLLPSNGLEKFFNTRNTMKALFSIGKASCILVVCFYLLVSALQTRNWSNAPSFQALLIEFSGLLLFLFASCSLVLLVIGVMDLAFQKWKNTQDLRMTLEEVKRENKEQEGDPMIKARIKRLQSEARKRRMLSDVAEATVVVRNPTHFAVALRYDMDEMEAPIILAKGADHLALKIIEIAELHDVPVVEDRPLARYLYDNGILGQPIPVMLYQAVARIIGFVRQMKG